jgi:putative methyltransferase (TIGR04325 family)
MTEQDFNIWEGVYENWDLAPADDDVFASDIWVDKISQQALKIFESYHSPDELPLNTPIHENALPLASAMLSLNDLEPLRVLDFGGGMGTGYLYLKTSLYAQKLIEYHIVEGGGYLPTRQRAFFQPPQFVFPPDSSKSSRPRSHHSFGKLTAVYRKLEWTDRFFYFPKASLFDFNGCFGG